MLLFSGVLGWHVGAGAFADWQVAVESAQVVAGLVHYPAGNPFYVYHTKLWTVLHQVLAVLLAAAIGPQPTYLVELIPPRARYSLLSLGYNLALGICGGGAPLIDTYLIQQTGDRAAPAFTVMARLQLVF